MGEEDAHYFAAGGSITNASPLAGLFSAVPVSTEPMPGDTLWITVSSQRDSIQFDGLVQVGGVAAGALRVLDLTAGVEGAVVPDSTGRWALKIDGVRADLLRASVPSLAARNASVDAALSKDTLTFRAHVFVDEERHAALEGMADVAGRRVHLRQLDVNLGTERWHLDQPSEITFGDEYRVRNFLLVERGPGDCTGWSAKPAGPQSIVLTMHNFRPASVADLIGYPDLGGIINADLFLSGEGYAPLLDGRISMVLEAAGEAVGALDATVQYEEGRLDLAADLAHTDQSTLTLHGYYPVDFRLSSEGAQPFNAEEVALVISADSFNVGWVEPFWIRR